MIEQLVLSVLVAAAAATAGYWIFRFRRMLPLERRLRSERALARDRAILSQELLSSHSLPRTPRAFFEALQFGVDRFLYSFPGVDVFVWVRMGAVGAFPESSGELVYRTGRLQTLEPNELRVDNDLWDKVFSDGKKAQWLDGDLPKGLGAGLKSRGMGAMRLIPWGTSGRLWGLIGVVELGIEGKRLRRCSVGLLVLAAYFESLGARSVEHWELNQAREELEGGLSQTMRRLDETNTRLIERAKEIKTLQEVTDVISEHRGPENSLAAIASIVAKALDADQCAFLVLEESTDELVTQPGAYGVSSEAQTLRTSLKDEEAPSVGVFRTGDPFITGDLQSRPGSTSDHARQWQYHSLLVVPLRIDRNIIGVLRVGSEKKNYFTSDHLQFVSVIAEEAAVLLESAMLSRKLAETNRQLQDLHQIKDDFVSTVSHEFKTPLTSIQGFVSVLLDEEAGPLSDEQRRFLGITKTAAERLSSLVNDMLDLSKLEGGLRFEMEPVALGELVKNSVERHRWQAGEGKVAIELDVAERLPEVRGNPGWLTQVVDNLVSNAVKFTPEGGRVAVSLENKGEGVEVTVADSGIGIPESDQARVFDKFYRASNRDEVKSSGTGLGLAICRRIVDGHDGRIWFTSKQGRGTTFHVMIPIVHEEAAVASGTKEEVG